ncbi:hypothetical protein CL647_03930 [bacterium]|nr:hypothetical protein [Actinomycetota bacterium]MBE33253.1 hypothetical protein [bacterium]|tara:strand:+ start:1744 stop:2067 length:324 start_codon:yes stop_codon:yes gene_type:complete
MSEDQNQQDAKPSNDKNKINVTIPADVLNGRYANLMINNFSKEEFILDFALVQPHAAAATVNSRVILSPRNAKKLVELLSKHVAEYEKQCGPITDDSSSGPVSFSFN